MNKEYNKIIPNIKVEFKMLGDRMVQTLTDIEWANATLVERLNVLEAQLEDYRDLFADLALEYARNRSVVEPRHSGDGRI